MHPVSLDDIQLVNLIARLGSFAGAAEHRCIPRPNVSRRVKQLEQFLGVSLFIRSTRKLSLTPEGEAFLLHSQAIEQQWKSALEQVQLSRGKPSGELRISALGLFHRVLAGPVLSRFIQQYPDIKLEMLSHWQAPGITKFDADLLFNISPLKDKRFVNEPLSIAARHFYASPAYLSRNGVPAHPRDLDKFERISTNYPDMENWEWCEDGRRHGLEDTAPLCCDEPEAVLKLTLLEHGIACLPEFICREHVARGELVQLFGGHYAAEETLWAIYPKAPYESDRCRLFIDMVRDSRLFGRPADLDADQASA